MEGEPIIDTLSEREDLIKSANSFEDLYQVLRQIGDIRGTAKTYTAERLVEKIEMVRKGEATPLDITRTYGIRDKVQELLAL